MLSMGSEYVSSKGLSMSNPVINGGASSVNGIQLNGIGQSDPPLADNAGHAGGTFQNSTPGDQANYQPVGYRSPNIHTPVTTFMHPEGAQGEAGEFSALRHPADSNDEGYDDEVSDLSVCGSSTGSVGSGASSIEEGIEELALTAGSAESTAEDSFLLEERLAALLESLKELESLPAQSRKEEDKIRCEKEVEALSRVANDKIKSWFEKHSELLNKLGLNH